VRDLEATTPFYRDGLGLQHVIDLELPFGVMRRFACGDGVVKLVQLNEPLEGANPPGGLMGGTAGLRWFTVTVENIEEAFERCLATGGHVVDPIHEWWPGAKIAVLEDPERNCWVEIAAQPRS
jgi:predicted enzyme related to lactoylglutathione lyase